MLVEAMTAQNTEMNWRPTWARAAPVQVERFTVSAVLRGLTAKSLANHARKAGTFFLSTDQIFRGESEMTTELEALKKRVEELENAAKLPEPFVPGPRFQFDPTANASTPASAMKAMINAVPEALMRDLRADAAITRRRL
jgi:hypothetical protein